MLPLLEFALSGIWQGMEKGVSPEQTLKDINGVGGALAHKAQDLYDRLSEQDQRIIRRTFLRLINIGEGIFDIRRRVTLSEVIAKGDDPDHVRKVLINFSAPGARLITLSSDSKGNETIEITHEALFEHWGLLKKWIDEHIVDIRLYQDLSKAAKDWEADNKAEGLLWWQSPKFDRLEDFYKRNCLDMTALQTEFYEESKKVKKREEKEKEAIRQRELEQARALAEERRRRADEQTEAARKLSALLAKNYWFSAAKAIEDGDWLKGVHFSALAGTKEPENSRIKSYILNIQRYISNCIMAYQINEKIKGAVFSKDENRIITWGNGVRVWNAFDGKPLTESMPTRRVVFSRDESRILTWNNDTASVLNAFDGKSLTELMKHEGSVIGSLFSRDGSSILTWSEDGTSRIWNTSDGKPLTKPMKHEGTIEGAIFSRDGSRILIWDNYTVRVWNASDGKNLTEAMKHSYVKGAIFSRDGSRILTWNNDTARVWNASDGKPLAEAMKYEHSIKEVVFSRDESRILTLSVRNEFSSGTDYNVQVWNASDGKPITAMEYVNGVVFSRDGSRIMTWSSDHTVNLLSSFNGKPITAPMKHEYSVIGAVFSRDESRILTWSNDSKDLLGRRPTGGGGIARVWNASDGKPITESMKHEYSVSGAIFSRDESRILTWSYHGTACVWNASDGKPVAAPMKHESPVLGAVFSRYGRRILTLSGDGIVRVWNVSSERYFSINEKNAKLMEKENAVLEAVFMQHKGSVSPVFSRDGRRILTWNNYVEGKRSIGIVSVWNAFDGKSLTRIYHKHYIRGAVFSRYGSRILTWSGDGTARIWNASDGKPLTQPMKHESFVRGAVFNRGENRILTWCDNGDIRVWNASEGKPITEPIEDIFLRGAILRCRILTWGHTAKLLNASDGKLVTEFMRHEGPVLGAVFNVDESRILTWSEDGTARIWNASDGKSLTEPMKHELLIKGAVFSKDESRILTWSEDGTARLWNASDGKSLTEPMKHEDHVNGAIFSKDGSWILTCSEDGTARLWNVSDGKPVAEPLKHKGSVLGAIFSKYEKRILTWSKNDTARLWDISADYDFPPEHLSLLVEIATGTTMDYTSNISVLSKDRWEEGKEKYIEIAEEHLKTCKYKSTNIYLNQQKILDISVDNMIKIQDNKLCYTQLCESRSTNSLQSLQKYIEIVEKHFKNCKYKSENIYSKRQKTPYASADQMIMTRDDKSCCTQPCEIRNSKYSQGLRIPRNQGIRSDINFKLQFQRIAGKVLAEESLNEILVSMPDEIAELFDSERVTIYMLDGEKQELVSRFKTGKEISETRIDVRPNSIAGYAARKQRTVKIKNAYDENELKSVDPELSHDKKWDQKTGFVIRQILAIPIFFEKYLMGILQLINKKDNTQFSPIDERAATELARIIGIGLHNYKEYQKQITILPICFRNI